MHHASQIQFGRLETCAKMDGGHDKWDLLSALTKAAEEFELTHRTLSVLKALMTFLPDRMIPEAPGSAIVFPSNRTLSERLTGMPESTLRRHLARLTALGIVSRHNSPNRKRYARRSGDDQLAFGFDLSPLARHAGQVFSAAVAAKARRDHQMQLRDRVAQLRQKLAEIEAPCPALLEDIRKLLRRKPDASALQQAIADLEAACAVHLPVENPPECILASAKVSASDSQNERHIQDSNKFASDSEDPDQSATSTHRESRAGKEIGQSKPDALSKILQACPEVQTFYPDGIRSWQDADRAVEHLSPMMGIDLPVLQDARAAMGRKDAATAVLCMLERMAHIRSPGAYLRRLAQKARTGQFSPVPMLNALLQVPVNPSIVS